MFFLSLIKNKNLKHICFYCPSVFESLIDLTNHLKLHGAVKEMTCKLCDFSCNDKKTMRLHQYFYFLIQIFKKKLLDKSTKSMNINAIRHLKVHRHHIMNLAVWFVRIAPIECSILSDTCLVIPGKHWFLIYCQFLDNPAMFAPFATSNMTTNICLRYIFN